MGRLVSRIRTRESVGVKIRMGRLLLGVILVLNDIYVLFG